MVIDTEGKQEEQTLGQFLKGVVGSVHEVYVNGGRLDLNVKMGPLIGRKVYVYCDAKEEGACSSR